jgi:hypothetical protein
VIGEEFAEALAVRAEWLAGLLRSQLQLTESRA